MPTYKVTDPQTNLSLNMVGDQPPTEQDIKAAFENHYKSKESQPQDQSGQSVAQQPAQGQQQEAPPVPELVAGTEEQMMSQRARNLQQQLGLKEPISPTETLDYSSRLGAAMMPTAEEKKAYYESVYGRGSFMPLSADRALVLVPDKKGGKQWVIDNPKGLDFGDIYEYGSKLPEAIAGGMAAAAAIPSPQGGFAKALTVSGVSAAASNLAGAIQDVMVRGYYGLPIKPEEIAKRRGLGALAETAIGSVAMPATEWMFGKVLERAGSRASIRAFLEEGKDAKKALQDAGINPVFASETADAVRASQPSSVSTAEAGDILAKSVGAGDAAMMQKSQEAARKAATAIEGRTMARVENLTTANNMTNAEVGNSVIGGAKKSFDDAKQLTDAMFTDAVKTINEAATQQGLGRSFINLDETKKLIAKTRRTTLTTAEGEQSDLYTPLLGVLRQLDESVDVGQKLMSVRQLRTMIGQKIGGEESLFPGMDKGFAKKLYAALSDDIDTSIAKFSGDGADKLKAYNAAYKAMLAPTEASDFGSKIVSGAFKNPEDVVAFMSRGGTSDWAAARQILPPPVFDNLRRGVMNDLMGSAKVSVLGADVADIGAFARNVSQLEPEVKNVLFGGSRSWQWLEKEGKAFDFLNNQKGLFSSSALPSMSDIKNAMSLASQGDVTKANPFIRQAIEFAAKRRNKMAESMTSQLQNGTTNFVAANPEGFFDSIVLSGNYRPEYIKKLMDRLPPSQREKVGTAAFQYLFEKAQNTASFTATNRPKTYSFEQMLKNVYGSKQQQQAVEAVIGPERMNLIKNWAKYELSLSVENATSGFFSRRLSGVLSRLPYRNLAAAGFTSYALEKASGQAFLNQVNPNAAKLFAQARLYERNPTVGGAALSIIQKARATPAYGNYLDMMHGFTPEQQDAIDGYLLVR